MSDADRRDKLLRAFKVFDERADGTVDTRALTLILSSLGKRLSPSEVNELVSDADQGGRLYYTEYVDKVLLAPAK